MFDSIKFHERQVMFALRKVESPKERLLVLGYGMACMLASTVILMYIAFAMPGIDIVWRCLSGATLIFIIHLMFHFTIRIMAVLEVIKSGSYKVHSR